ncbi:PP2C family protein-serine/threonine phosphatase [Thermostaphylospora chromogena]|uniref:Serine phosphatase RsbU, regulator of sigma subunit n=1 Tax=Thermostaphylospora chromogena TaxID=35622 RepID=A0A1H1FDI7_9ACTN|nr:PP2C family protein-serine/threonine phosphatase [Thermostaphylospora chromogena]SDQ98854.1 Serine phosphatase RsbU, regulator of sigma subunit [Thermostaphylospora chromogena]
MPQLREVWTPTIRAFTSTSEGGRPPTSGIEPLPRPGVARHRALLSALIAVVAAVTVAATAFGPAWAPPVLFTPILLIASLYLPLPATTAVVVATTVAAIVVSVTGGLLPGQLVVVTAVAMLACRLAYLRDSVGIHGMRGSRAINELRTRLRRRSQLPSLPAGWGRRAVVRHASAAAFGGDFIASALDEGRRLHVAVVDVAGKGEDVAARALTLSGVFSGLIATVSPEEYLPACNRAVSSHDDEGMVTVVYAVVDLNTGAYQVWCAGHPPAAVYSAGSGTWQPLHHAGGIALGVVDDAEWQAVSGTLGRGEALMLVSDGAWGGGRTDPDAGLDRLLGRAADLLARGGSFPGIVDLVKTETRHDDDGVVAVVWRT